jgi:hypothetical protein
MRPSSGRAAGRAAYQWAAFLLRIKLRRTGCLPTIAYFHNVTRHGKLICHPLWLVAWVDAGTKAAAKNGDIVVIKHADQEMLFVLFGLYFRITTVVYGD